MKQTITQIITAKKGTYALYKNDSSYYQAPIIAWALVTPSYEEGEPEVKGITAIGGAACSLADEVPCFIKYVHTTALSSHNNVSYHPDLLAKSVLPS